MSAAARGGAVASCALLRALPLALAALLVASAWADPPSRALRVTLFFAQLLVTSWRPRGGALVLVATACWMLVPTLAAGLPPQYGFEAAAIGYLTARALADRRRPPDAMPASLWAHPFAAPSLFVLAFSFVAIAVSTGELLAFAPVAVDGGAAARSWLVRAFRWEAESPAHGAWMWIGLAVHLAVLARLVTDERRSATALGERLIVTALALGGVPSILLAYVQVAWPATRPAFMTHIGGLFTHGNLLSFQAALIALWSIRLATDAASRRRRIAWLALAVACLPPLMWGQGRTAWCALAIALVAGCGRFAWSSWRRPELRRRLIALTLVVSATGLVALLVALRLVARCGGDGACAAVAKLSSSLARGELMPILFSGERWQILVTALRLLADDPLHGIGLGNFWSQAGYRYEVHNLFVGWAVHDGVVGVAFAGAALALYVGQLRRRWSSSARPSELALSIDVAVLVLLFVPAFFDHYFTHRDLALGCSVWLALPLARAPASPRTHGQRLALCAVLCGLVLGVSTLARPQTRPILEQSYGEERSATVGAFRWSAPIFATPWADECIRLLVRPLGKGTRTIRLGSGPPEPDRARLNRIVALADAGGRVARPLVAVIEAGRWNPICACRAPSAPPTDDFYLLAPFGAYFEWLHAGGDGRFVSFAVAALQPQPFARLFDPWADGAQCSLVYTLDGAATSRSTL